VSDVNDDLKELLQEKSDEMRLGQGIPQRVLRRSRRRRVLNTALAGSLAVVLGVGAFVGARAAMGGGPQAHGGPAGQGVSTPAPSPSSTASPATPPTGPLAAIVVSQPSAGDTVTSPVQISGTADVFEAQVSYAISDASGNEIAGGAVAASCGSGCRGTFSIDAAFHVSQQQAGTIEVYEASAKDGSRIHVVDIPVTLQPGGVVTTQTSDVWTPPSSDATDPQKTAIAFARDVMGWAPNDVRIGPIGNADQIAVDIWNTSLTSTFTHETATTLVMHTTPAGGSWSVMHAETGVLDVTCPSNMQDALIPTDRNGQSTMEICGTLAQSNPNWTVQATVEYAASNLQPSEAESAGEIPVQGTDVHGWLPLTSTYAYPKGSLASLQVQVLDQNKNVIAESARTLVTTG